jgi:hypothetical protein
MYFVLSAFTSRPSSLLASIKVPVFFFVVSMLSPRRFRSYIYIYIYRERERESARERGKAKACYSLVILSLRMLASNYNTAKNGRKRFIFCPYILIYLWICNRRRQSWYQLRIGTEDDNNKLLWKAYLRRLYYNKLNNLARM